jgi:hypothetical protein
MFVGQVGEEERIDVTIVGVDRRDSPRRPS